MSRLKAVMPLLDEEFAEQRIAKGVKGLGKQTKEGAKRIKKRLGRC
jgi:hypothetical protein|tara:strand:- start:12 stop:149 length:138 start_codon:yes stop_codon:yes gene_type:complete